MNISLLSGFLAGLGSFIAPCTLPMIPVYLMYLTGSMDYDSISNDQKKTLIRSVAFVLGFTIVFVALGVSSTAIGRILFMKRDLLRKIGAILIIFFGIAMLGFIKLPNFGGSGKMKDSTGFLSSVLMGMAFSIGFSPCSGPILGGILVLASTKGSIVEGALLLLSYSLGLGIPFIISGFFASSIMNFINKNKKLMNILPKITGVIMIAFGVLMYFNKLAFLSGL